jgi:hypothetical protein
MRAGIFAAVLLAAAPAWAQVARVSVSTAGVEADGPSGSAAISGSGRFVVFASQASNLVPNDTNGLTDIFLRDRDTDADGIFDEPGAVATARISMGPNGAQSDGNSFSPAITPDGRFVFFGASATDLAAGSGYVIAYYRLDRTSGTLIRVLPTVNPYVAPAVSDDGNVVFAAIGSSLATPLVIADIAAGRTTQLPPPYVYENPTFPGSQLEYRSLTISSDGARVGYVSFVYIYRGAPYEDPRFHVYDRATATTTQIADGYLRDASLLASGGAAIIPRASGMFRRVIATGAETSACPYPIGTFPLQRISPSGRYALSIGGLLCDTELDTVTSIGVVAGDTDFSDDGRFMAVSSVTAELLPGNVDTNGYADVFVFTLADLVDADHDSMNDSWEALFGVTDPSADPDGDGQTNAQEEDAGTHPNGQVRRFLAEGSTSAFFRTAIGLANPSASPAAAVLTFDRGDGTRVRRSVAIPAGRSVMVDVGAVSGLETSDVSTTVESDRVLAVQREMTWGLAVGRAYGSHAETATAAPSTTWFLAEGSTVLDFDLFYLLQNPQATTAHTTVRFLLPSGATVTRTYDLAPGSRTTIYVNLIQGLGETDVSGDISADVPIVVERAMYRTVPGQPFGVGHNAMGVTAAATEWFLAEGATGPFFDLYVLIANPGSTVAVVEARYAKPDGTAVTRNYTVGANSRHSVFVESIPGLENTSVATTLTSSNGAPFVAERAMYWPGGFFDYYEGHSSAGSTTTAAEWVVAGAESGGATGAQTYVLIANTANRAGEATITLLPDVTSLVPPPPPADVVLPLPANSRTTVPVTLASRYGVRVRSTGASPVPIVVESAVYRSADGVVWSAGANALATPVP